MKNSFKRRLLLFLLTIFTVCAVRHSNAAASPGLPYEDIPKPDFSTPVTPEEVREAFYRYSAPAIVEKLMENKGANWDMIMSKVKSGDDEWIEHVTSFIAPGAEGKAVADITIAYAYALPKNPEAVLLVGRQYPLYNICSLPFPEQDAFIEDYAGRALSAIKKTDKPYLREVRNNCAIRLKKSLEERGKK